MSMKAFYKQLDFTMSIDTVGLTFFGSIVLVIFSCRYLRIRQQYTIGKMSTLNGHLKKVLKKRHFKAPLSVSVFLYGHFQSVNTEYSAICRHITVYSAFCQPLLTIIIPMYITRDETPFAAKVVQCHGKMARENGEYLKSCLSGCLQLFGRKKNEQLYIRKSRSAIIYYISVFFMLIIKN
ncbi:hypothetical protein TYRP_017176 [Tyrophagus putrescentiae]|nr:hypothetical protein TYRP_017176 [Tyrophagus putrescentiae]